MLVLVIIIIGIALLLTYDSDNSTSHSNNSNLTLDVDRMYKDSIDVTMGRLSEKEKRRRMKSGYYMVQKGQEYSSIEELRKKRVNRLMKEWDEREREWAKYEKKH